MFCFQFSLAPDFIRELMDKNTFGQAIQSTIADRPTLGTMLWQTQKEHEKQQIEVGEYVEHVGKHEYMAKLREIVERRQNDSAWKDKYYLLAITRKNPVLVRVVEIYIQARHTRPIPEPGLTLYSYDPSKKELKLEWVLPHKRAFNTFLKTEAYTDPFLIECIKKYQQGTLT